MNVSGPSHLLAATPTIAGLSTPVALTLVGIVVLLALLLIVGKVPLKYNLRNLQVRWRTTIMTGLAFTLVISLLTVMLAFVNGMYRLTEGSGNPSNLMILSEGSTDESFSNLGFSDTGDIENQPGIARDGTTPLCSKETYLVVNQPLPDAPPGRPKRRFLQLRGVDDPDISALVHEITLHPGGTWFSNAGVRDVEGEAESRIEAVVGEGVARILVQNRSEEEKKTARHPTRADAGDTFSLGGRMWLITGVMQSTGSTFDSEVWAKRSTVGPIFGKTTYTTLSARCESPAAAAKLKSYFNNDYKKSALNAQVETDYFNNLAQTNKQFLYAIIFVALIMAVGGVFGVMNTMFAAISQRRKDIGVLELMGFSRSSVVVSFLLESLIIALLGGILGCGLGMLVDGYSATSIISSGQGGGKSVVLKLAVDPNTIAIGMILASAMGLLGGLIPAFSATRVKPLEALR